MNTTFNRLGEKIIDLHSELRHSWQRLTRIAVALYDQDSDDLQTFVNSTVGGSPLVRYQARLAEVPSLKILADSDQTRVIDDLTELANSTSPHTRRILEAGFKSSFTVPLRMHGHFIGFLFFDADEEGYFTPNMQHHLLLYAQLIGALIAAELLPLRTLTGAVATAQHFSRYRDEGTASHLSRMAHVSRLVASGVADKMGLDDEYIEFIYQFAPLHDVGKVAIPDRVLLKAGKLDKTEQVIMRNHVNRGVELIDHLVREFRLEQVPYIDIMRNIVSAHHEFFDGSGYPLGLSGNDIPVEGRIVAVADVFDALVSDRPYKSAWSFDDTMAWMLDNAGSRFDPDCVDALFADPQKLLDILSRHGGAPF